MDNVVEKYSKNSKAKWLFIEELINGILLLLMLFYGKCVFSSNNIIFISYIILLFFTSYLLKLLTKLFILYKYFNVNLKIVYLFKISKEYEKYMQQSNKKYIKKSILNIKKARKMILINYLSATKEELGKLGIKEIAMMSIGIIVGASFTETGEISLANLSIATFYVLSLFLASSIFYFIFLKIVNNYRMIVNKNIIKNELLSYILEIEYEE